MKNKKKKILIVGPFTRTGGVANHTMSLVSHLKKNGQFDIHTFDISPESKIKIIQDVKKVINRKIQLKEYLKANQFDIVHTQSSGGMPAFWSAQTTSKVKDHLGIKFIMTFHHSNTEGFLEKNKEAVESVLKNLDHLILVSNPQKEQFKKAFPWFKNISVIPNGYSPDVFHRLDKNHCRNELGLDKNEKILLNIGNLEKYKGQEFLILAMKSILKHDKNVHLYIIGKGSLKSYLYDLIKQNGLEKNVKIVGGNKPREEIPIWYNTADLFVLPSINESFGMVQIEALACGVPVVATYNGGSEDIITNDDIGILVKSKKPKELSKAIIKALQKTDWDEDHLITHSKQYTWESIIDKTNEIYTSTLKLDPPNNSKVLKSSSKEKKQNNETKKQLKILMVGPFEKTGGVANHTRSLIKIMDEDKDLKITTYDISPQSKIRLVQNVKKYVNRKVQLKRYLLLKKDEFDIIHIQSSGGMPAFWSAQTVSAIRDDINSKVIMTFHHSNTKGFVEKNSKAIGEVLRKIDQLIVVSNLQKSIFLDEFPWFKNITVIPNGYNDSVFKPMDRYKCRKKLNIDQRKYVLVNIANLETYKGQKYLIKSMKEVIKKNQNIVAYIIGKGSLENQLNEEIKSNKLSEHVFLAGGNKPFEELPIWVNASNAFILPSLAEGNPTVMFESMACGIPFIGTNVGGIPEVINNTKLGYLVNPKDVKNLTKEILRCKDTKWDTSYIIEESKKYNWNEIVNQTKKIYFL